jgi:uncharacterized PurR-regulated membrane protein YhhQ (DUF165 family)
MAFQSGKIVYNRRTFYSVGLRCLLISALLVSISYIAAQILSDIGSLQIVRFMGLSMDAGTFIYPITFTLRDLAHKALGLKGVRVLIISAAVINLFMALYFWFVARLTPDTTAGSSGCLLYTSPSPRDRTRSRMPSSA